MTTPLPTIALIPEDGRILRPLTGGKNALHPDNNSIWITTPRKDAEIFLNRHADETAFRHWPEEVGRWAGHEIRTDTTGTRWRRNVYYVTSDTGLGDLVEVPK